MNILISACLLGIKCRYDGQGKQYSQLDPLLKSKHKLIPVCPEQLGGRPTPRIASEIKNGKVIDKEGNDVTKDFISGAEKTLDIAKSNDCSLAIFKSKSPSCGFGFIYDGTFSGTLINGNGIAANYLNDHDITILNENNYKESISDL